MLTKFCHATGGDGGKKNFRWLKVQVAVNNASYTYSWYGVSHSAAGLHSRVLKLPLSDNRLEGKIPPELGHLTELTHLNLAGNRLSGCVPASLRNVRNNDLSQLDLPYCP